MKVTFRFTSQLATAAGASEEVVETEKGSALLGLLRDLSAKHGPDFAKFVVDADGSAVPTLVVAVNGAQVSIEELVSLDSDSEVMLITPMSGG
ncbi:MAG: MoaD/ThiS family protein [Opitutales bacterium]